MGVFIPHTNHFLNYTPFIASAIAHHQTICPLPDPETLAFLLSKVAHPVVYVIRNVKKKPSRYWLGRLKQGMASGWVKRTRLKGERTLLEELFPRTLLHRYGCRRALLWVFLFPIQITFLIIHLHRKCKIHLAPSCPLPDPEAFDSLSVAHPVVYVIRNM